MKRGFLHWFYLGVQFVMLAVSIPKVATLFHAYDTQTLGPLVGGVDLRSWLVGVAIDLTATFTTWAAMHKYEESRKRTALLAPALIILMCTALSVVANYEDAATLAPAQYAHVNLFTQPALLVNPMLISAPPVLVLLLILLVPSVLAQPRIKSAGEIAAEVEQQLALIDAEAQLKERKARANARVRGAQLSGLADTVSVVAQRAGLTKDEPEVEQVVEEEPEPPDDPAPLVTISVPAPKGPEDSGIFAAPSANVSKAMWNTMPLKERVQKSGLISAQEVAEVLGMSTANARKLAKGVRAPDEDMRAVAGRSGVPYQPLIDALYTRRTNDSFAQAQKLEKALGLRKRARQLHVVPDEKPREDVNPSEVLHIDDSTAGDDEEDVM